MTTEANATAAAQGNAAAAAAQPAQAAGTVATAVGTPAAAAAAPAASTTPVTPEAKTEAGTFGEVVSYQPTGNSNLDLALGFAGKHGLSPEHPAMLEASKGNFGPVKALFAEKGVQGWEAYIALAEEGYKAHTETEAQKTLAIQNICVSAAGGEQEWADVLGWASQNAEPAEKEAVNSALAQGGVVAEAVAAYLVGLYRGAPGTTYSPTQSAVKPDAGRGAGSSVNTPLSPRQFAQESQKLRATLGVEFENTPEYKQLVQRRTAYRG
ncbi:hypothetical protein KZJ38_07520 [Paraburkholderia edwinii]|uniref:Scaffolding-like protein n=1 Tax=Paraburkholderia edwinii TaxID=2861782 RepID=A0ABX8UMC8_9BURK|nr:hypothetical protein [Paraburkholderia edwinii]QYD70146.1 hypothetical protein KZJ38_07520 [Paraburkholderia edwinii]